MSSLISWAINVEKTPVYDNIEYAKGCDAFYFKAKDEKRCWDLYYDFLATVPSDKFVKAYRIGLKPDYPIPVSMYFIEVCVDDIVFEPIISLWTVIERGRFNG